ncbi:MULTISPECIES: TIGR03571 family LLM class oxidoreductase [unclassified Sinorhizobium]|uniref:TIGR03571 family LLM class oxidoreductase n=1 Tax=unclassified Sinorhizobium TaxID=2613772 RepID=UPI003526B8B5
MLFEPDRLSLGLVLPMQSRQQQKIDLSRQIALAQKADRLGFSALWVRDVPLNSRDYPDPIGHSDPWVLLGALAVSTSRIHLVTGAIVLPLRHPLHIAKAALSMNDLSSGRFVLGLGSGDRPSEFALFGRDFDARKELFRINWTHLAAALGERGDVLDAEGIPQPMFELLPRLVASQVPMLAVGSATQSLEWIARNAIGWATYHRPFAAQRDRIALWRRAVAKTTDEFRSFSQAMALELVDDPDTPAEDINLGYRLGRHALVRILRELRGTDVHHVMFNLTDSPRPVEEVLDEIAAEVMPAIAG